MHDEALKYDEDVVQTN